MIVRKFKFYLPLLASFLWLLYAGQSKAADIIFHVNQQLLSGKKILKVKRDFKDPFVWVLAEHNEIFRVNSLTMEVADYSNIFKAYNAYQFIDIAGSSADRVFIATNSPLLIYLKDGTLKAITAQDGLTDAVSGIGISNFSDGPINAADLYIGTAKGLATYNPETDVFFYFSLFTKATDISVYEATYRKLMSKSDYAPDSNPDYFPLTVFTYANYFAGAIYRYPESGSSVKTAFFTHPAVLSEGGDYRSNIYWGNNNGMYQQAQTINVFNHYLDHIPVNKITDIYSFVTFGNPNENTGTLTRENLLIGTAKGLYYSHSIYGNYTANDANVVILEHFDPLGDLPVNDICVNSTVSDVLHIREGCENGVWLGTDNGLIYLKPDFTGQASPPVASVVGFEGQASSVTQMALCEGSSTNLVLDQYYAENNDIQWFKNGNELAGISGAHIAVSEAGTYKAVIYNSCSNVHVTTNELKVTIIGKPQFSFNYPDVLNLCDQQQTVLQITHQGTYQYRWLRDNIVLGGQNTDQLSVTQSGSYSAEVSSCDGIWLPSKAVQVNLALPAPIITSDKAVYCSAETAGLKTGITLITGMHINWFLNNQPQEQYKDMAEISTNKAGNYHVVVEYSTGVCAISSPVKTIGFKQKPVFSFDAADEITKCGGETLDLKVTGDPGYQYRWYKDGILLNLQGSAITVSASGNYKAGVSNCPDEWTMTKEVKVHFNQLPEVVLQKDRPIYCEGSSAILSLNQFDATGRTISWLIDGSQVPKYAGMMKIETTSSGTYTVIVSDATGCSVHSASMPVSFEPIPAISISQSPQSAICDGSILILRAVHNAGQVRWSTGQTGDQISVSASDTYRAYITNDAGCEAFAESAVIFDPSPVLAVPDATICEYTGESVTLSAPANLKSYEWNGVTGGNTFVIKKTGQVLLHVTDQNGCEASETIMVNAKCADVHIPNTFTPNGDGFNDRWVITGLDGDQSLVVRIFNRYGSKLYEHIGFPEPWDGTKRGSRLPAGVYYYLIKAKNGHDVMSGSLTLLY